MSFYLAIVSPMDAPLYELQWQSTKPQSQGSGASTFPSWSSFTSSNTNTNTNTTLTNGTGNGNAGTGAEYDASSSTPTQQSHAQGQGQGKLGGQLGLLSNSGGSGMERHLAQMVAFAALDSVDEVMESTGSLYLKSIDRHNQWIVSAFLATSVKFVLLHDQKNDDGIRLFFIELWELYVKTSLNPFHTATTPIRSPAFDNKVRSCAKRNL